MLLDAASLYFRAFYGVPTTVTAPDGRPVNAVRGFLDMTARLVVAHRPDRFVACWDDDWRPAFRTDARAVLQGAPASRPRAARRCPTSSARRCRC